MCRMEEFPMKNPETAFEYEVNKYGFVTITKYKGTGGRVTVPAAIDGNPVDCIGKEAFRFCGSVTQKVLRKK